MATAEETGTDTGSGHAAPADTAAGAAGAAGSAAAASAGTGDPLSMLRAQFAAQAADNPGLAMLLQFMQQGAAARSAAAEVVDERTERPESPQRLSDDEIATLVRGSEAQSLEIEALRTRNDMIAAALGACHVCFGEDAWCLNCGGAGKAGSVRPEPVAYARFVKPLLRRLRPAGNGVQRASDPPSFPMSWPAEGRQ